MAGKMCIPLNKEYFEQVKGSISASSISSIATDLRNTWMICTFSIFFSIIVGYYHNYSAFNYEQSILINSWN